MATRVCAPSIVAEMKDWVALGGGNSGCCGDANHTYGFHCTAQQVPASDYSRRRDTGAPKNVTWCCAGDFGHSGKAALRARHADVLAALEAGLYPMLCEFIGQPIAGRSVLYWCRWEGKVRKYTGPGHTTWTHLAWWRSQADQRPYMFSKPAIAPGAGTQTVPTVNAPAYPGYVLGYAPSKYDGNVLTWQGRMKARGWTISADGFFGPETLTVVKDFQAEKSLGVDGLIGEKTWTAAWESPVT